MLWTSHGPPRTGDDTGSLTAEQIAALPTVDMVNYRFEPSILRAAPGQPVAFTFTNDTDDAHAFAVEKLGIDIEVPSGRTRTVVVQAPPASTPCTARSAATAPTA
ncbi:cupredoxin domain-containing protein [Streptomyces sp. NPDC087901]|uniref:cupredoxin domain-containing protein n=1 Tax=Streptomyces sp. NPDC087901 TaxID=3365818 RepID=UPI0037FA6836